MSDAPAARRWSPHAFLIHLNQRHPDTVLFLARHLTGNRGLEVAELVDVHADQMVVRVATVGGPDTVSFTLGSVVASRAELIAEMVRIVETARRATPGEPLTSLEADITSRPAGRHGH